MATSARGDEITERVGLRRPAPSEYVDTVEESGLVPIRSRSLCRVDAAIARLEIPAARARASCETTRTAAIGLTTMARSASAESRTRSASGMHFEAVSLDPARKQDA